MGGLRIFAYILGTDNDTCVRSQGLNLLWCVQPGCWYQQQNPALWLISFLPRLLPLSLTTQLLTQAAPASLTISDKITAVGSTAAGRTWWPPPQLLLPVSEKCLACQPHPLPGAVFVNQFHLGPLSRR
jgi:hypothetical protein